jgi:hypothetical protein
MLLLLLHASPPPASAAHGVVGMSRVTPVEFSSTALSRSRRGSAMRVCGSGMLRDPPPGGSTEDLPELLPRRRQAGALPGRKRVPGAVRVQVEHRHGRLKLGAFRPPALEDGTLEAPRDAGWRALEKTHWEVHGVRGLLDLVDPGLPTTFHTRLPLAPGRLGRLGGSIEGASSPQRCAGAMLSWSRCPSRGMWSKEDASARRPSHEPCLSKYEQCPAS